MSNSEQVKVWISSRPVHEWKQLNDKIAETRDPKDKELAEFIENAIAGKLDHEIVGIEGLNGDWDERIRRAQE